VRIPYSKWKAPPLTLTVNNTILSEALFKDVTGLGPASDEILDALEDAQHLSNGNGISDCRQIDEIVRVGKCKP